MTIYAIIIVFFITAMLPYLEEYMGKYKLPIYMTLCAVLILVAGLREIGIDPDSENYELVYRTYYNDSSLESKEYSFIYLAMLLNQITPDAHAILLFYAFFAVTLHFFAFRQLMSDYWFLPVLVYVSFYFEMHEMIQIRTGALSAMFLLSIKPLAEGRRLLAAVLIAFGCLFHVSGLALFPLLFLSNKPMSSLQRWIWAMVIPVGYLIYFAGAIIQMQTDIPFIGDKLMRYQFAEDTGKGVVSVQVFNYIQLFAILAFYYLLYFYDTISDNNKYFPLLMKIFAIGVSAYAALAFLPVLSDRFGYQLKMVNIILYACILYTIKPKWASLTIILCALCAHFAYIIRYTFFWK